jgi:hypothetical protein
MGKNIIIVSFLFLFFSLSATPILAAPQKIVRKASSKISSKVYWSDSAIRYSYRIPSQVRKSVMKKIENYAIKKHISKITPAVIDGMRE